jgi:hypothetical protein
LTSTKYTIMLHYTSVKEVNSLDLYAEQYGNMINRLML